MRQQWIFYIIIGVTAIQWIFGKIQEQAAQKRAQQRLGQRPGAPTSASRTTLPTRPARAPTTITQADLQARRQAQLRALRERQAKLAQRRSANPSAPSRVAQPRRAAAPQRPSPPPVRPSRPVSAPPARRAPSAPLPSASRPQPTRPSHRPHTPKATNRSATSTSRRPAHDESSLHALRQAHQRTVAAFQKDLAEPPAAAPDSGRQTSASLGPAIPRTRDDWRRAIIASEILGKPMALRPAEP